MGFLSPWFLGGLLAVGLPVFLHLLRRRQTVELKFSSLMFFEQRSESSVKHRRLEYLLLFCLRVALLALLALAFANPYVLRSILPGAGEQRLVVLAIDNSFSMRAGDRLEQAKQEALSVLGGLSGSQRVQVLSFAAQAQFLGQPSNDANALRGAIQAIEATDSRSSLGELARVLRSMGEGSTIPLDVHVFSDMQRTSLPPAFGDLRLESGTALEVHNVGGKAVPNWTVESVSAPSHLYGTGKAKIQVTVAGFAAPEARRQVTLLLNGKPLETKAVTVPENARATVEFLNVEPPYGLNRAEARIDSADTLPGDDRFAFALPRLEQSRILFVHQAQDKRSPLYFRTAVDASAQSAFSVETMSAGQAANVNLKNYALVVLSDVGAISPAFEKSLAQYVNQGGGLWVAAGPATAIERRIPVLGAAVTQNAYQSRGEEMYRTVSYLDTGHAALQRAQRWEGVRFYRSIGLDTAGTRVLARLGDQTPLLVEKTQGQGRMLVFTSTFDNISNDLPLRGVFVPFVEQSAYFLSGLKQTPSVAPVDSFVDLRAGLEQGAQVEVIGPDGERVLSLAESTSTQSLELAREGFYEIRRGRNQVELLAANADRRESDLTPAPEETLALWKSTGEAEPVSTAGGVEVEQRREPLWWYLLLLMLMVGIVESAVASRHLDREREAA